MTEQAYVLGTHDDEIARLGLQHEVWRPFASDAWRRAGLAAGQTVIDVGCGPGYSSLDLARIVGRHGRVIAVDRSPRFLDHLERAAAEHGFDNVRAYACDLDADALPDVRADAAWCRWIYAFVRNPRTLLTRVAAALSHGGSLVVHEYYDYASWRLLPRNAELEEFVAQVMASWRAEGGEPDVGAHIPTWLDQLGFERLETRALVHLAAPGEPMWEWPAAFVRVGSKRLVSLGRMSADRASEIRVAFDAAAQSRTARVSTPAVIEIVARKPAAA